MLHSMFSRLSVASVLTLVVLAASASLQPEPVLASQGAGAILLETGSYLQNEWDDGTTSGNEWDDGSSSGNEWDNNGDSSGNEWDNGGGSSGNEWDDGSSSGNEWVENEQGIFVGICALPWFATHPACTGGLLGLAGG